MSCEMLCAFANYVPVIGYAKALFHHYRGDPILAEKELKAATHGTGVIIFGIIGEHIGNAAESCIGSVTEYFIGRVTGCFVGSIVGGLIVDQSISKWTSIPYGYFDYRYEWLMLLGFFVRDGIIGITAFVAYTSLINVFEDTGYAEEIKCYSDACEKQHIQKDKSYRDIKTLPKLFLENIQKPKETPVESLSQLHPGDHIVYKRGKCWMFNVYDHHAIVGDVYPETGKYTVYEQASSDNANEYMSSGKGWIKEMEKSFEPKYMFKVDHGKITQPEDDVRKTAHYICHHATPDDFKKKYNVVLNNCEHFANFCATRRRESQQVQQHISNIIAVISTFCVSVLTTSTLILENSPDSLTRLCFALYERFVTYFFF